MLTAKYGLHTLPALLFFSPDGELLYRAEGFQDESKFYGLVKFATDPKSQEFRAQIDDYKYCVEFVQLLVMIQP